jgi:hypothetical protein
MDPQQNPSEVSASHSGALVVVGLWRRLALDYHLGHHHHHLVHLSRHHHHHPHLCLRHLNKHHLLLQGLIAAT